MKKKFKSLKKPYSKWSPNKEEDKHDKGLQLNKNLIIRVSLE